MGLKALISAYQETVEGALRATLPLAGRTVIERQARLASMVGVESLIILVERMPPDLSSAIDRLRRDRIGVTVARSAEEAAELVDPEDRLLLIGDGFVADPLLVRRMAACPSPALLTVPDQGHDERYERIDAASRWGGLAVLSGALARETAAMLHDWDPQSTLLRRTVQAGPRMLRADSPVAVLAHPSDLSVLERQILESAGASGGPLASRLLAPVERLAAFSLMATPLPPAMPGVAAAVLTALGAFAFLSSWLWTGLLLLLLATPLPGVSVRLGRLRMQDEGGEGWWSHLLPILAGAALLALCYALAPAHGWGMILLGANLIAFLIALRIEVEQLAPPVATTSDEGPPLSPAAGALVRRSLERRDLLPEPRLMTWMMLPFAVAGYWHAGPAFLFVYAAGAFFWVQHQVHAERTRAPEV